MRILWYRAIDKHGVMHSVLYKGALWSACSAGSEEITVGMMSFPVEEPLTCINCMAIEIKLDLGSGE